MANPASPASSWGAPGGPDVRDLRAIVTTRWGKSGYVDKKISNIENYYVDTALDNDADSWSLSIGDPFGDLSADLVTRDSEIRVKIFAPDSGTNPANYLLTGICDTASYGDGTWTLTGRDLSSIATDSTVPPQHFRHVRAWSIVEMQAKKLGFRNTQLAHGRMVRKVQYTDGSESYWDFWWRLYRKEQMWLWCDPHGTLIASTLDYKDNIDYYLGSQLDSDSIAVRRKTIPVMSIDISKSTQSRIGWVHVWWHKGDTGAHNEFEDPTTRGWMKRPIKVMMDSEAHSVTAAKKMALEEIFEGKVGAVEFKVTIPDPGFPLRQNKIVRLNVPDAGISGEFFVVGVRMQGDQNGFIQEVRLREKQYAMTRRIPTDPKLKTNQPSNGLIGSGLGSSIDAIGGIPAGWGDYYVRAAKEFHGPWDYNLYLATLIGISDQETGGSFMNERQNGGPGGDHNEWYPWQAGQSNSQTQHQHGENTGPAETKSEWEQKFANEKGSYGLSFEAGVGPMQLTSRGYKTDADDKLRANFRDQFAGGRWHPEWNIWVGAQALREKLRATVGDTGRDMDMWAGVAAYNGSSVADSYARSVKVKVMSEPGYLQAVKQAVVTARDAYSATDGAAPDAAGPLGSMFKYAGAIIGTPGVGTHSYFAFPNNWQSDNAVDISTQWHSPVYAVIDGTVGNFGVLPDDGRCVDYPTPDSMSSLDRFGGNRINIIGKNQSVYYAHLCKINRQHVYAGAHVKTGYLLGWTGVANGVFHLHFAVEKGSPYQFTPGVSG